VADLGEWWFQYSGRPFVHAVLCAREGERWDAALAAIAEAREVGLRYRELIARQEADSPEQAGRILEYLTARIFYDLGPREQDGLAHFLTAAKQMGLCHRDDLVFYGAAS